MDAAFLILELISFVLVVYNFIYFIAYKRIKTNEAIFRFFEVWTIAVAPAVFLMIADIGQKNDCCTDSALFSPEHRTGIYFLIISCMIAFLVSVFRAQLLTPVPELLLNMFLILGLVINILLCIHLNTSEWGGFFLILGNIPIIMLILIKLIQHQNMLRSYIEENAIGGNSFIGKKALSILKLDPIIKYPVLLIMIVPILILISLFLLLFGQKPDAVIRAFTETYKHGLSQWDYKCDNVQCGGHYLCSVAANGHKKIVKPKRLGIRNGNNIICNRQLLISNAFEDLIKERFPFIHKAIRRQYNKVGDLVHRYYSIFNNKFISDLIYILMKPAEWILLLTLYTFDRKPENRIAKQYLSKESRQQIDACAL